MRYIKNAIALVTLVVGATIVLSAQLRPGSFSALTLSSSITQSAADALYYMIESDAGADSKRWYLRANGGAWSLSAQNDSGDGANVMFTVGRSGISPTTTSFSTAIALATVQNLTTTSGSQDVTLNSGVSMLRVTTGGDASDDLISHISGGVAGRILYVCWIAETTGGDGPVTLEQVGTGTDANRIVTGGGASFTPLGLGSCVELIYDGTSSRWRALQ